MRRTLHVPRTHDERTSPAPRRIARTTCALRDLANRYSWHRRCGGAVGYRRFQLAAGTDLLTKGSPVSVILGAGVPGSGAWCRWKLGPTRDVDAAGFPAGRGRIKVSPRRIATQCG